MGHRNIGIKKSPRFGSKCQCQQFLVYLARYNVKLWLGDDFVGYIIVGNLIKLFGNI
jgi:hypothetical protein